MRSSGEQKLKEDDAIIQECEANNSSEVLFFAKNGDVFKMKAHEIPDSKASLLGEYIQNLVGTTDKEEIMGMAATDDFSGNLLFCFENGKVAKVPLSAYMTKSNRKKLSGGFSVKSPLVRMFVLGDDDVDLILRGDNGRALLFNTDKIPLKTTRTTQGVNALTSKKDSKLSSVETLEETDIKNLKRFKTKISRQPEP